MAWDYRVFDQPGAIAGSSFTTGNGYNSTGQFLIVKSNVTDNTYVPCTAHTDRPSGIAQNNPASGDGLQLRRLGVSKVVIGTGGLTAGDEFGTDTQGKAVRKSPSSSGADYGDYVLGEVIEGGSAGELATVMVYAPYHIH